MNYEGPYLDPAWQGELDTITPPASGLSWLKLVWVAGDVWQPINRWVVYQMIPYHRANELVKADLKGPSPRVRGRYDRVLKRFIPDPNCNVDRLQWELFQQTGYYGRPYWIVQGSGGGHKRTFNRMESAISALNGGPKQPPAIGDLPFANPDRRTFDALAKHDLMRGYSFLLDRVKQSATMLDIHEQAIADGMSAAVWRWLEGQVSDVLKDERRGRKAIAEMAEASRTTFDEEKAEKRALQLAG